VVTVLFLQWFVLLKTWMIIKLLEQRINIKFLMQVDIKVIIQQVHVERTVRRAYVFMWVQ